ncbi:hypothetical protein MBM_00121 [Drepanopeziza brunnea f. sp. 'multigermtubi' MB_m1]|uniref:Uncharacterized protein n=1 Tax=Marssonina brunnea f. sp. multigermtubi (strain MB_m1) TaxID=1072389 RepID=K1XK16_MARBU|nr:uncharacterized protein MBM_00121 [Drepanopeziza brunnea f. sp. 'multigermtubi' MB_m1]EKD21008.1 hypothetical protein MBM_00121 [Drepanopeziza brunnea f. sp. 'multigermtubi' MB_m1]
MSTIIFKNATPGTEDKLSWLPMRVLQQFFGSLSFRACTGNGNIFEDESNQRIDRKRIIGRLTEEIDRLSIEEQLDAEVRLPMLGTGDDQKPIDMILRAEKIYTGRKHGLS